MPALLKPKPLIFHESRLVKMIQELELEGQGRAPIVQAIYVVLDRIREQRKTETAKKGNGR